MCFFEWVYFSNVASVLDDRSVYMVRASSGELLAEMEDQPVDDTCIVVPVPDTAKAAADDQSVVAHHSRHSSEYAPSTRRSRRGGSGNRSGLMLA